MHQVEEYQGIGQIEEDQWDALATQNTLASHGWLRTIEEFSVSPCTGKYWLIRDADGILAAVPGILRVNRRRSYMGDRQHYGRLAPMVQSLRRKPAPLLWCGAQLGSGPPVLLRPGLSAGQIEQLSEALLRKVTKQADANGWSLAIQGAENYDEGVLQAINRAHFIQAPLLPDTLFENRWDSFAEFLLYNRQIHPATEKNMRQQINRGRRLGVIIEEITEIAELTKLESRLHQLLDEHFVRLNQVPFPLHAGFLTATKARLGKRLIIYVARRNDHILGVVFAFRYGNSFAVKSVGVANEALRKKDAVYFNLTFHHPIQVGIREKVSRISFGTTNYTPKTRRGMKIVPMHYWVHTRSPIHAACLKPLLKWQSRRITADLPACSSTGADQQRTS
jgi:predicted N-acyltransferase